MMTDDDLWIYLDGPEPELLRPLLSAMREVPPPTPDDKARVMRAFRDKLDATLARPEDGASAAEDEVDDAAPPDADPPLAMEAPPAKPPNPPASGESATVRSPPLVDLPDAPALLPPPVPAPPASPGDSVIEALGHDGGHPQAPGARAPAHLAATAPLDLHAEVLQGMGKLPFQPPPPGEPPPRPLKTRMSRMGMAETFPVGDDSITRAVPAVPFAGITVPPAVVQVPDLTLSQYASLCAELTVEPERSEKILVRYRVPSKAVRAALDDHWGKVFADQPEKQTEFAGCFARFISYVRARAR